MCAPGPPSIVTTGRLLWSSRTTIPTMNIRLLSLLVSVLAISSAPAVLPVEMTFTGEKSSKLWSLSSLNTNLPSDWSAYEYLVLEFKASSSQRFDLGIQTGRERFAKRIGPFAGVWVRASIPLRYYRTPAGNGVDLAATFNQPRGSYWINIHSSGYGPLTNVAGLSVSMDQAVGKPTLQIRSVALAATDPGDAVLEGLPLVDEFGQYTRVDWTGKARSLDDLKNKWDAESRSVREPMAGRDSYGGFSNTSARATGFFRTEQIDGRWWLVDPDGHLFFSTGVNGVGMFSGTRVQGREDLFATQPPANPAAGPGRNRGGAGSFYTWNLQRRFGDGWQGQWAALTSQRMAAWGLNTMHNWGGTNRVEPAVPYALMMRGWQTSDSIMGMPDVYSSGFVQRVDEAAASQLEPRRNDPMMLGYFIGNEPPWPGREGQLCSAILAGPESGIQKRLKEHLAAIK